MAGDLEKLKLSLLFTTGKCVETGEQYVAGPARYNSIFYAREIDY
jgi:hypothetical protein